MELTTRRAFGLRRERREESMRLARAAMWSSLALLLAGVPAAGLAADAGNGGAIAARWCANCHAVTPGQRRSDTDPPAFAQIARNPAMDAAALGAFLMTPHPRMPDMSLSRREIEDLVAFIKAQGK
jgi:mono/diheme cytochrome c family protein